MHLCSNEIGTPITYLTDSDTTGIDVIQIRIAPIIVGTILYQHFLKYRISINIKLLVNALDSKKYILKCMHYLHVFWVTWQWPRSHILYKQ